MKIISLAMISFIFSANLFSQAPNWSWARGTGGGGDDGSFTTARDSSGNIYAAGSFQETVDFDPGAGTFNLTSTGDYDIFILKLDSSGNFVWAKAIGGTSFDRCLSIALDASGNVYCTGQFTGTVDFNPGTGIFNLTGGGDFISKLDSSGNFVWAKAIAGAGGYSISLDASDNVYATGYFSGTVDFDPGAGTFLLNSDGSTDIFILKLTSAGNFVWARGIGGGGNDIGWSVAPERAGSGDVYTTGIFMDTVDFDPGAGIFNLISTGNSSVFISKLSSSGDFIWAKAIGGFSFCGGISIAVAPEGSGSVYTTGFFSGTNDFNPGAGTFNLTSLGSNDIFVSKLDSSGNFVWAKQMGGINNDVGLTLAIDASENIYTSGFFEGIGDFAPGAGFFNLTSAGNRDLFVSKLDSSGNFVWAKETGGASDDDGRSIALDAYGNVTVVGDFNSPLVSFDTTILINAAAGSSDVFIATLDAELITGGNESESFGDGILLFPNPAVSELRIENAELRIKKIEIYNTVGEKIFSQISPDASGPSYQISIDTSQLLPGIYFIAITGDAGNKVIKRVIKM